MNIEEQASDILISTIMDFFYRTEIPHYDEIQDNIFDDEDIQYHENQMHDFDLLFKKKISEFDKKFINTTMTEHVIETIHNFNSYKCNLVNSLELEFIKNGKYSLITPSFILNHPYIPWCNQSLPQIYYYFKYSKLSIDKLLDIISKFKCDNCKSCAFNGLSLNKSLTFNFVQTHKNHSWSFKYLSRNKNFYKDIINYPEYPWNFSSILYYNTNFNADILKQKNRWYNEIIDKSTEILTHKNIWFSDIIELLDVYKWDWKYISRNPNITINDVVNNLEFDWNWETLSSYNNNITSEDVDKYNNLQWVWEEICYKNDLTLDIFKNNEDKFLSSDSSKYNNSGRYKYGCGIYHIKKIEIIEYIINKFPEFSFDCLSTPPDITTTIIEKYIEKNLDWSDIIRCNCVTTDFLLKWMDKILEYIEDGGDVSQDVCDNNNITLDDIYKYFKEPFEITNLNIICSENCTLEWFKTVTYYDDCNETCLTDSGIEYRNYDIMHKNIVEKLKRNPIIFSRIEKRNHIGKGDVKKYFT